MTLYHGSTPVGSWSDSGTSYVDLYGTCTGKWYAVLYYSDYQDLLNISKNEYGLFGCVI